MSDDKPYLVECLLDEANKLLSTGDYVIVATYTIERIEDSYGTKLIDKQMYYCLARKEVGGK